MGFLDWLFRAFEPPKVTTIERIWLTEEAMLDGLVHQVREAHAQGRGILVLGHFPDDLGLAVEKLQEEKIKFRPWKPPTSIENAIRELKLDTGDLWMAQITSLPAIPEDDNTYTAPRRDERISVLVLHHHPEIREDERVLNFAVRIPVDEVICLSSLDHPIFRRLSGENLQQMLRVLGVKEDEALESPLIHRQITRAQRRVAELVPHPQAADSAEEWFDLNFPKS